MTVFAQDTDRMSQLVKHELWPSTGYCRLAVTAVQTGATDYVVGTVLGKITASGKYQIAVETAEDGSDVPAAIVIEDKSLAAATDTVVLTLVKGPAEVSKSALVLDASFDSDAKKAAAYAAIEAAGINVLQTV